MEGVLYISISLFSCHTVTSSHKYNLILGLGCDAASNSPVTPLSRSHIASIVLHREHDKKSHVDEAPILRPGFGPLPDADRGFPGLRLEAVRLRVIPCEDTSVAVRHYDSRTDWISRVDISVHNRPGRGQARDWRAQLDDATVVIGDRHAPREWRSCPD